MTEQQAQATAGYAPSSSVLAVIDKARQRTVNGPIDRDLLRRIGVPESLTKRTINSLRSLCLIDDAGKPTPSFEAIIAAKPDDYPAKLAEFLHKAYGDIFTIVDPATASPDELRNAFWGYEPRGQIDNMIRLFVGLCEAAQIVPERPKVVTAPRKPRGVRRGNGDDPEAASRPRARETAPPPSPPSNDIDPTIMSWVKRMPPAGQAWPKERKDRWFEALRAMADDIWPDED